jgi:outer membrane protein TolC
MKARRTTIKTESWLILALKERIGCRIIEAALLSLLAGVSALAQSKVAPLSLDDCVRLALSAPSSVTLARQQSEIARYGLTQARAGFLPQAQVHNLFTYNSPLLYDPQAFSFVALNGVREYSSLLTATQEVDISGRLRAALLAVRLIKMLHRPVWV